MAGSVLGEDLRPPVFGVNQIVADFGAVNFALQVVMASWSQEKPPRRLFINTRGEAQLREAARLWGTTATDETQDLIKQEVGESLARVACIGKAGESQIPFA